MLAQEPRGAKNSMGGRCGYNGRMKRMLLLVLLMGMTGCAVVPTPAPTRTATIPPTIRVTQTPARAITAAPSHTRPAPSSPTTRPPTVEVSTPTILPPTATAATPAPPADPVLAGAGDIAVCEATGDEATAKLLEKIPGTIFTLGDNVYPSGTLEQFHECYEPSWGRLKARTRPAPGNHDYATGGARGYYEYFGASAGEPGKGYYSYDLGAWHVIVLNSEIDTGANSAQLRWLRDDLAGHPAPCTAAIIHRPLFSSGPHGADGSGEVSRPLWDVLYENNADLILSGHDHDYERFAPQNPQGERDAARGIRQFVVGTGGASPYVFDAPKPNSEKRIAGPFGVLQLTLHPKGYDWEFVSILPLLFKDSGAGTCH